MHYRVRFRPIILFLLGIILVANEQKALGTVLLLAVVGILVFSFVQVPWKEIAKKKVEEENQLRKSMLGRVKLFMLKSFDYIVLAVSIIGIVLAVIGLVHD